MIVLIRKEQNGSIYIDKENGVYFETLNMDREPYNFKKIIIDDKYEDCHTCDFNDDLSFNVLKYQSRKEKEKNIELINDYKRKLSESDYKAIKYAEGLISEIDYAPIKAERENYRKAINSLEISIK